MSAHTATDKPYRVFAAISVTLAPLCFLVLPGLFSLGMADSPREALAESAALPATEAYGLLFSQLVGASLFVVATVGIVNVLTRRRRSMRLRAAGAGLAFIGAFSAMALLGMELAQTRVLRLGEAQEPMVDVALAIQEGAAFGVLLLAALAGLFAGALVLIVALWRAEVIPGRAVACLALPVLLGLLPLPGNLSGALALVALLVPFVWVSWAMVRLEGPASVDAPALGVAAGL